MKNVMNEINSVHGFNSRLCTAELVEWMLYMKKKEGEGRHWRRALEGRVRRCSHTHQGFRSESGVGAALRRGAELPRPRFPISGSFTDPSLK